MTTHILLTTGHAPGKPDTYKAACGYISRDPAEFIDPTANRKTPANCPQCNKGKTCRKCNEPAYIAPSGYKYQLCVRHIKENMEALKNG